MQASRPARPPARTAMTAEDLMALPDYGPNGDVRHELDDGQLIEMPPPKARHGLLAAGLAASIGTFAREHGLGQVMVEAGFILRRNPDTVVGPDVSVLRADRLPDLDLDGYIPGPPDLAIEIVSPSDSGSRLARKVRQYLQAGASLVWVVDPERQEVDVYRSGGADQILRLGDSLTAPELLPGWSLPLADVFR